MLVQAVTRVDDDGSPMFRVDDAAAAGWPSGIVAILVTVGDDPPAAQRTLRDLRVRDDLSAYAPVLVIDAEAILPDAWVAHGADQVLTAPPDQALLDRWTIKPNAVVPRLIQHFGQDAIVPLLVRFRASLLALDGAFIDGDAHKVGGLAGTLGYAPLSSACAAVLDDPTEREPVLREVRKAIYDVSQHLATYAES